MRIVLQRVKSGRVSVDGVEIAAIGPGMVILFGVGREDMDQPDMKDRLSSLAEKIANLRIFDDEQGKINRSILDIGGEAIIVSQFTLYADTRKGRRPSFTDAAPPEFAEPLVKAFIDLLSAQGIPTQSGKFGAHMLVEIANDGPVTIVI